MQGIKCMLVGDSKIGKTHLFQTFTTGSLPQSAEYIPTVFDTFTKQVTLDARQSYNLALWDSAGDSVYDEIRPISYPHTDCFLICYSVADRTSFQNVESKWKPEILKYGDGPSVPLILAGLKSDLRPDDDKAEEIANNFVSYQEGAELKERIGAKAFFEVSTQKQEGKEIGLQNVDNILQAMIESAVARQVAEDEPKNPLWGFEDLKILIVGDSTTGKSSVLGGIMGQKFKQVHEPTTEIVPHYRDIIVEDVEYFLTLIDVPSAPEFLHDRIKEYEKADGIIFCYAVNDPFSFQNVENQWIPEVAKYRGEKIPSILLGNKSDLKEESEILIPAEDGQELQISSGATAFIEVSAKSGDGLEQLFLSCVKAFRKSTLNSFISTTVNKNEV